MRTLPLFVLMFVTLLLSCRKNETVIPLPVQVSQGVMQKLLKDSSSVFLIDRKDHYDLNLYPTTSLDIGFIFQPTRDITISSIGCMSQELGKHQVILRRLAPTTRVVLDTLLIDTVTVSKDSGFVYKDISKPVVLSKNSEYVIYAYNASIKSVWNALYTGLLPPSGNYFIFPMSRGEVIIKEGYTIYYSLGFLYQTSTFTSNGQRGLVDFIYK